MDSVHVASETARKNVPVYSLEKILDSCEDGKEEQAKQGDRAFAQWLSGTQVLLTAQGPKQNQRHRETESSLAEIKWLGYTKEDWRGFSSNMNCPSEQEF